MSASDKLRKISLGMDHEEEDIYAENVAQISLDMIEKLADEAASEGDVRATYLKAQVLLCRAKKLKEDNASRVKLIDEARGWFEKAALNGSAGAAYDIASQEASILSNNSVETLAYNGLIEGDETIRFMLSAYETEQDFTTSEDMTKRAIARSNELKSELAEWS